MWTGMLTLLWCGHTHTRTQCTVIVLPSNCKYLTPNLKQAKTHVIHFMFETTVPFVPSVHETVEGGRFVLFDLLLQISLWWTEVRRPRWWQLGWNRSTLTVPRGRCMTNCRLGKGVSLLFGSFICLLLSLLRSNRGDSWKTTKPCVRLWGII